MKRRDFVKAALAATVSSGGILAQNPATRATPAGPPAPLPPGEAHLPPGPLPWMRGLLEVKPLRMTPLVPDAVARTTTYFFSDREMATFRQFCEILLPPIRGYPGALDAETPEFLDFLISISPPDQQEMYRMGLGRLDAEAHEKFGVSFDMVTAAQADELIRPWLRTWMSDHPPTEPYAKFINVAHRDIRAATINSQAWHEADSGGAAEHRPDAGLYWYPVDPDVNRRYLPRG